MKDVELEFDFEDITILKEALENYDKKLTTKLEFYSDAAIESKLLADDVNRCRKLIGIMSDNQKQITIGSHIRLRRTSEA